MIDLDELYKQGKLKDGLGGKPGKRRGRVPKGFEKDWPITRREADDEREDAEHHKHHHDHDEHREHHDCHDHHDHHEHDHHDHHDHDHDRHDGHHKKKEKEKKRLPVDEAAVRKLARKSMSAEELRQFLLKKEYAKEEVEREIEELRSRRYLDDRKFAWEYLQYAFSQNRSKRRAFAELRKKGVSEEDMQGAFMDYEDLEGGLQEKKMARDEADKVLRMADLSWDDPIPEKIRGRIARRLSARGFSSSLIWDLLEELRRG